eukprot:scaffold733_cov267-Pinguiococcus_pyrenoidosus.AAC.61
MFCASPGSNPSLAPLWPPVALRTYGQNIEHADFLPLAARFESRLGGAWRRFLRLLPRAHRVSALAAALPRPAESDRHGEAAPAELDVAPATDSGPPEARTRHSEAEEDAARGLEAPGAGLVGSGAASRGAPLDRPYQSVPNEAILGSREPTFRSNQQRPAQSQEDPQKSAEYRAAQRARELPERDFGGNPQTLRLSENQHPSAAVARPELSGDRI